MVRNLDPAVEIFTIDTGRLFPETLQLKAEMERRFGFRYKVYRPDPVSVENFESNPGRDSIYESVANRKACCFIRKIEPLQRALAAADGWITGLRREQTATRSSVPKAGVDRTHGGILKICPLADWSADDVWDYIRRHKVPYNPLHDKGYASIGCEPCTRAVRPDEDPRAGRWWWEQSAHKECGLHLER